MLVRKLKCKSVGEYEAQHSPRAKQKYVGIEIECFSRFDTNMVKTVVAISPLSGILEVGNDGSIQPPKGKTGYEFRLLSKEVDLKRNLRHLGELLTLFEAGVNSSCGLHVHLDMRHRDEGECKEKLLKCERGLYSWVNPTRKDNEFCVPSFKLDGIDALGDDDHYRGINDNTGKDTIELRMHHGSVNATEIYNWCRLLISIVENPLSSSDIKTKEELKAKYLTPTVRKRFIRKKVA